MKDHIKSQILLKTINLIIIEYGLSFAIKNSADIHQRRYFIFLTNQ